MVPAFIRDFREFAVKGNVIDLAVAVIIGGAFGKIVTSLVADIIMPLVGTIAGQIEFSHLFVALGPVPPQVERSADALKKAGVPVLAYGNFLTVLVDFLIIAFVVFVMVRIINRIQRAVPDVKALLGSAPPPEDVILLREIRDLLKQRAPTAGDDVS